MFWKKIITATLLIVSITASAQDDWDLQKCIDYAREHNLQISQQQLTEQINKNNYLQSKLALLPTLNGNLSLQGNFGRSIDVTTYQYVNDRILTNGYSVTSNVILFNGLRQINGIKESKLNLDAAHFQTEAVKNNVMLNITQAYLLILQSQESLKALEEQVRISISLTNQAQVLLDAGTVPEQNLFRAQSQLATDSLNLITAQNNLQYSLVNLALLLQVDPQTFTVSTPKIDDAVPPLTSESADGVFKYALTTQPQVKSAELSLLAAGRAINIAKGVMSPVLSLFVNLRSNYSGYRVPHYDVTNPLATPERYADPYFDQVNNNFSQAVGLSLDIPILNGWQTRTNINNAKVRYLQSQVSSQQVKDQLKQDIYRSYTDAKSAYQRYKSSQVNVIALQTTYDYAQNLFELGASNAVDYSTAKSNLVVGQVTMINAKYEYLFKLKVLDFYQGKAITLNNETQKP